MNASALPKGAAWFNTMTGDEICRYFVEVRINYGIGPIDLVYGIPIYDKAGWEITIECKGRYFSILQETKDGWVRGECVEAIRPLFDTRDYELNPKSGSMLGAEAIECRSGTFYVRRKHVIPNQMGLYLDNTGTPWILTDSGEFQSWDFSEGTSCALSEDEARPYAPFKKATVVPAAEENNNE